jgi:hypothetical protein
MDRLVRLYQPESGTNVGTYWYPLLYVSFKPFNLNLNLNLNFYSKF